ncbi:polysaccharide deacetylase family protein [Echinicola vietnamensis]|uniref:Putative xylanase/chitin deacetylase n=1 Tax=Echinicola vietnamensis (strain DSM 17526 / LMG 23754 / KMM 6221) TaxID=926556 RepID=L0FZ08_ECHVK|nr:polysaccharide deacetylase family protein [Echinicola vietnamensis]AGA78288.1 putative xylanase/chitin deacetylase [Echinicola vietnamensis DSM 17526]
MEFSALSKYAAWGTVLILCWLMSFELAGRQRMEQTTSHGAVIRGDADQKQLALVFTGHQFAEGARTILKTLDKTQVKVSFFFTGDFYRNEAFAQFIAQMKERGHYLGAHSDKHLLYCAWENRDSLLVSKAGFKKDLDRNYKAMEEYGIARQDAPFYLPPYEWYNDSISQWAAEMGLQLVNFTPGTRSNADYTSPDMHHYVGSDAILKSILDHELLNGLNGFLLLMHVGVGPERADKFYDKLSILISTLQERGYALVTVDELL